MSGESIKQERTNNIHRIFAGSLLIFGLFFLIEFEDQWPIAVGIFSFSMIGIIFIINSNFTEPMDRPGLLFLFAYGLWTSIYQITLPYFELVVFNVPSANIALGARMQLESLVFFVFLWLVWMTIDRRRPFITIRVCIRWIMPTIAFHITVIFVVFISLAYILAFFKAGGFALLEIADRLERYKLMGDANLWMMKYAAIGAGMGVWAALLSGEKRLGLYVAAVCSLCFFSVCLLLGNRREFTYLVAFIFFLHWYRAGFPRLRWKIIIPTVIVMFLILYLGALRISGGEGGGELNNPLLDTAGEFIYPWQTFLYRSTQSTDLSWGSTYFSGFTSYFVPRVLWPGKPWPLGLQFADEVNGNLEGIGYAFMPLTESYMNFGRLGSIGLGSLLFLTWRMLTVGIRIGGVLGLVGVSLISAFPRSDFSSFVFEWMFIGVMALLVLAGMKGRTFQLLEHL